MENYKNNILLTFYKPDEFGVEKKARVTLSDVRTDLTVAEINEVAKAFASLIMHTLGGVELVQYSHVLHS
ncbi:DUF1659 domain-containing protein [Solibacillus sp. FSL H8-0538]|uniref:DUF1659 domain-containing protein n=1 Tax=Solibacillus sp. FSL H8-0538 TaxID=2921400 RepID=UPI0030FD069E